MKRPSGRSEAVEQARRLAGDFEWACRHVYRVLDVATGTYVPFEWRPAQRYLIDRILKLWVEGKPVRLALLKSRQFGGSTLIQLFLYWLATTRRGQRMLTVSHTLESAETLIGISRKALELTPEWLRPAVRYNSTDRIEFDYPDKKRRGSGLCSTLVIESAGSGKLAFGEAGKSGFKRGSAFNGMHLSEVAFWPDQVRLLDSLLSTVPYKPGTIVILESTPNMRGDAWWRTVRRAREGLSEFEFVFVPWLYDTQCVTHDVKHVEKVDMGDLSTREKWLAEAYGATREQLAWRRFKIDSEQFRGDADAFNAEYAEDPESCFMTTGNSVFAGVLTKMEMSRTAPKVVGDLAGEPPEMVENRHGLLRVYEWPEVGKRYAGGVDVSEGLRASADKSAIVVVNEMGRVAAVWSGRTTPTELAYRVRDLGVWYNRCMMAIERNAAGVSTVEKCLEIYPVLFTELIPNGMGKRVARVGWKTTPASKGILIGRIRQQSHVSTEFDPGVRDEELLGEVATFVLHKNGEMGATDGSTDDLVIAYGIALFVLGDVRQTTQVQTVYKFREQGADGRWVSPHGKSGRPRLHVAGGGRNYE